MARPESPFTPAEMTMLQKHVARRVRQKRKDLERHMAREHEWSRGHSDWDVLRRTIVAAIRGQEALLEKIEAHRVELHRYATEERRAA